MKRVVGGGIVCANRCCPGQATTARPQHVATYPTYACSTGREHQVVVTPTGYTIAAHLSRHRASPDSPRRVKVTALPGQAGSQVKSGAAGGVSSPQTPPRDIEAARDSPTIVVGTARVIPTME